MNEISKRKLALACCAALSFAVTSCGDDGAGTASDSRKQCGDEVCTLEQDCVDNHCVDKTADACDNKCTSEQECVDGECKDKAEDPCDKCTENQKCVDKVCKDLCGGEVCKDTQTCQNDTCKDLCGAEVCAEDKVCDPSTKTCIDPPEDPCTLCTDKQECVNSVCVDLDPCANKTCQDGYRCDREKDGECVEIDPCETVVCLAEQTCVQAQCIDNACLENGVEKDCGENKVCSKGECVDDGCQNKSCNEGWQCIKGICEETACLGKFCDEGRSCKGGICVDNECLDMTCDEGKVCSKGDCLFPACLEKEACPVGKTCDEDGDCVFIVDPAISLDEPEDKTTDEDGKTASLTLHLNNAPTSDVRISCEVITESPNPEVEAACDEIVFNADNWQLEQTIILTGINDHLKDGDQTYKIKVTTSSEDIYFNELSAESVELTNIDTTKAGVLFSETQLTTYEDQTADPATFTVVLTSIPSSDVRLTMSSSNPAEGTVSPTTLTFTKDNWGEPQTVTVKGVDDEVKDGNKNYTVFFSPSESNDEDYAGFQPSPIKVTNVDNDVAGISMNLSSEGFELNEGQYYPLTIKLNTQPKNDVKVALSVDDDTEAKFEQKEVTLTAENWKTGVEALLNGVADHVIDGDQPVKLTFTVTSEDEDYNLEPIEYAGTVKDLDIGDIVVSMGDSPIVREGTNDMVTLSVSLASKPTKEVSLAVSLTDESELKINKQALTFKPEHWDIDQDILVNAVDDDIVDGDIKSKVVMKMTSGDTNFNNKSKEVEFTTIDNDEAGFEIVSNAASFPENSASTSTLTVALKSQPLKDVKVNVASSDATELQVTSASQITFTTSNWKTPQTVSVKVVDDNIADGQQTANVIFTGISDDPNFNGIKGQSANFTIIDNDSASLALTIDPTTIAQGSPSTTASVSLGAEPSSNVTVKLVPDHANIITFEPATVTFTTSNWKTAQNIKVNVNFSALAGASAVENIYAVASGDAIYSGVKSKSIPLTLTKIPQVQNFEYTGKVQSVNLPAGKYKLEVWGAKGGDGSGVGGLGGYSTGTLTLTQSSNLYIYVGGQGSGQTGNQSGQNLNPGGFNGGGENYNTSGQGASGGGATDIRIAQDNLYSRVIVAAGGGGGAWNGAIGGAAGGTTGINGGYTSGWATWAYGLGGTQTAGGSYTGQVYSGYSPHITTAGSIGQGGSGNGWSHGGGGGGGGWYGGGGATINGGGGGSSWVYTASNFNTWKSGNATDANKYTLNSNYYLTSTQLTAGNASMPSPKGGTETGHAGNGYARITLQ
ncbi:MAG: hypothetical protein IJ268_01255 [Proteobacteria bacterium]|nr:hypothetical protein [Pseudomonadota bacterium]